MREQFLTRKLPPEMRSGKDFEYLVITVAPAESLSDARQRLREHAEYGKWELHRSVLYLGGGRKYWLRRRVMHVTRTA